MIKISANICPQNHRCPAIRECQFEAITQKGNCLPEINQDRCQLCLTCVDFCPMRAIKNE